METIKKIMSEGTSIGTNINNNILPDKFRASLHLEHPSVEWRFGKPPTYETANNLFEQGRTKEWPKESLEETVQNAVKSWQMEFINKARLQDFKTINPEKFKLIVNGREGLSGEEILKLGGFNAMMQTSLPEEFQLYKEIFLSSPQVFKGCFPRGFAWEVIEVYSGPPLIAFKFRHWGFFEGPYKSHSPTGDLIQLFGLGTLKVDLSMKIEEIELYFDPGELFGALLKGKKTASQSMTQQNNDKDLAASVGMGCPLSKSNK